MEFEFWYLVIAFLLILNIVVSVYLLRRDDLEPFQKGAQVFLVWLIPFVAAIGLWLFHRSNDVVPVNRREIGGGANDSSNAGSGGD